MLFGLFDGLAEAKGFRPLDVNALAGDTGSSETSQSPDAPNLQEFLKYTFRDSPHYLGFMLETALKLDVQVTEVSLSLIHI